MSNIKNTVDWSVPKPQNELSDAFIEFRNRIEKYDLVEHKDAKSTSIHNINGDRPLTAADKAFYLLFNHISNNIMSNQDILLQDNIEVSDFILAKERFESLWSQRFLETTSSPSRVMCDMFWMSLPWEKIENTIGPLKIADLGCGKGQYLKLLRNCTAGIRDYRGFDHQPRREWSQCQAWGLAHDVNTQFETIDLETTSIMSALTTPPADTNLIISQSFMEHIKNDLEVFEDLRDFMLKRTRPTMQVHLLVASAAAPLFLLHGYRQYGIYALKQITDLYRDPRFELKLYKLADGLSNKVHFEYITDPIYLKNSVDGRETAPDAYRKALKNALLEDMTTPIEDPSFWALVIETRSAAS